MCTIIRCKTCRCMPHSASRIKYSRDIIQHAEQARDSTPFVRGAKEQGKMQGRGNEGEVRVRTVTGLPGEENLPVLPSVNVSIPATLAAFLDKRRDGERVELGERRRGSGFHSDPEAVMLLRRKRRVRDSEEEERMKRRSFVRCWWGMKPHLR
ncbi:hypothetical protein CRENBAI_012627 [Crenichthys baileyi]|uniref:Uncharacterized protein n=1 Tax=Crenichthys baileyi TaxID=28760 RepID=A0AAV9SIR5_9TELE